MSRLDDPASLSVEDLQFLINICDASERYDDMCHYLRLLISIKDSDLSIDERNRLSTAYMCRKGTAFITCRVLKSIERKEISQNNTQNQAIVRTFLAESQEKLGEICREVASLVDERLLGLAASAESRIFYLKMKADYLRSTCEFDLGRDTEARKREVLAAYESAMAVALTELRPTHIHRLSLVLSFATFYYEVLNLNDKALALLRDAYRAANEEIDSVPAEELRDVTTVLQLVRDNLTLLSET